MQFFLLKLLINNQQNNNRKQGGKKMKLCMTVEEAAEAASVSDEQIRQWANSIDFPSFKIGQRGGKRLIHTEAFNDWLRKQAEMRQGERYR